MTSRNDKIKLIVAVVALAAAAVIFAVQFLQGGAPSKTDGPGAMPGKTEVFTDSSGAKEIRRGSHAVLEPGPEK